MRIGNAEFDAGVLAEQDSDLTAKPRVGVNPCADGRASERELEQMRQRGLHVGQAVFELRHVARELLTEGEGGGVLEVGSPDLDDVGVGLRLVGEGVAEAREVLHRRVAGCVPYVHQCDPGRRGQRFEVTLESADSLFVRWQDQGAMTQLPRFTRMRSPDREVLLALLRWFDLNVAQ